MSKWTIIKSVASVMAVIGGILLILSWGLYLSLWSIIGLALGGMGLYSGYLIFDAEYVRGGTISAACAVIAWGLYPFNLFGSLVLVTILLLGIGGVISLALELMAD
jgi:hypothetical protein